MKMTIFIFYFCHHKLDLTVAKLSTKLSSSNFNFSHQSWDYSSKLNHKKIFHCRLAHRIFIKIVTPHQIETYLHNCCLNKSKHAQIWRSVKGGSRNRHSMRQSRTTTTIAQQWVWPWWKRAPLIRELLLPLSTVVLKCCWAALSRASSTFDECLNSRSVPMKNLPVLLQIFSTRIPFY